MRIGAQPRLRIGDADLREQLQRARSRHRSADAGVQREDLADLRLDGVERIERGHRLLEDDRDVVAADFAHLALAGPQELAPLEVDGARRVRSGRIRQQLQDRERADRFARAGLADQRHALPALDRERDMVDGKRLAECDREVADIEQGLVDGVHASHPFWNVLRGSKASRTASPMKIRSDSMIATAKKPVKPSQGACTLALPCASNSPSDGEPGGRPKPRKSSAVSVITDDDTMNGRNVMVATMALGKRCRNMMTRLETPSARAAWMYSKLRPRRNSARTSPTSDTQENSSNMPSSTKKPGTSTEERISSR